LTKFSNEKYSERKHRVKVLLSLVEVVVSKALAIRIQSWSMNFNIYI